jgi:hypothetical protein
MVEWFLKRQPNTGDEGWGVYYRYYKKHELSDWKKSSVFDTLEEAEKEASSENYPFPYLKVRQVKIVEWMGSRQVRPVAGGKSYVLRAGKWKEEDD